MKKIKGMSLLLVVLVMSGCEAIGTIFKGGMWFGIFIVVAVVILILYLFRRRSSE